ncbi:uncharacterized protein LOC108679251 [Hyalella azteca]|uniref:Uncharacterized protein LOC108679251 n=1 Tax=Hyalella azteca TaxID=294128 RepID=A0A8B7PAZ7_HYAAZ|nr:uncharacterized protein LOC108679251 [Hyalella azteca]
MSSYVKHRQCFTTLLIISAILVMGNITKLNASPTERQLYYEVIKPAVSLDTGPGNMQQNMYDVPRKRAAIAFDKLMYALKKALDSPGQDRPMALRGPPGNRNFLSTGVDRRGQPTDNRLYWRCYFNAVSCF